MVQTTLLLPEDLKSAAEAEARARGISFGELVRRQLRAAVNAAARKGRDPIFSAFEPFDERAPATLSEEHDAHLYEHSPAPTVKRAVKRRPASGR